MECASFAECSKCQADKVRIIGYIPLSEKIIMCHIIAWQNVEVKLIFPPDQIKDIIFYFGLKSQLLWLMIIKS